MTPRFAGKCFGTWSAPRQRRRSRSFSRRERGLGGAPVGAGGFFRRQSTGEVIDSAYLDFAFPYCWRYDVLRALDSFRRSGKDPEPRMAEA
ncbi:MAG: hypothetical protein ABI862_00715 [Ilumatobacteraceae bacterium]